MAMTTTNTDLTPVEWRRLNHLRVEISRNPAAIVPEEQEEFAELFARSLVGKGDQPIK
jgi:hypothetical protein